jgi:hypothetical protein
LAKHLAVHCAYKQITCPDPQCNGFKSTKKSFLEHLTTKHEQFLFENFEKLWQKPEDVGRVTIINSNEQQKGK